MAQQYYITDGVNVNAGWVAHIAVSTDGNRWEAIAKDQLSIHPTIRKANTSSPTANKEEVCRIQLKRAGINEAVIDFDVDNVANQPAWTSGATILDRCMAAVMDIGVWLGTCCAGGSTAGLATESTLQQVLMAIQNGQDFEAKLVVDDNGDGDTYLEIRIWNPDTQTWETPLYYTAGSNVGVPAGSLTAPIIYLNPTAVLNTIAGNTAGATNTFNVLNVSGAGNIPAGIKVGSVLNVGGAAGTLDGVSIPAGASVPIPHTGKNDTYGAVIPYDASGTVFIIQYTT